METNTAHTLVASACISKYFLNAWKMDADTVLETELVAPKTLLSVNRLDLACKLYYIDCLEHGLDMTFARELYQAHIETFSGRSFIEPGLKTKNSIRDYLDGFGRLIADIRTRGFDPEKSVVPVGDDGVILDGSHRTAIAIYYDIPLTVVRIPGQTRKYDYQYFRENGLDEVCLDFMAEQFIRFSERVYTVCLWPASYDSAKLTAADRMIRSCAAVAYRKEVALNYHGVEQLMISFYKSMSWTGTPENGYAGIASKATACYRSKAPTTVYVICGPELEQVLALKQRIRDLYGIENSSLHITDTHEEAVEAGKMLLNQNSVDFLNYADPFRDTAFIRDFIRKAETGAPCSGPDVTMALYGIGDRRDRDDTAGGLELLHPRDHFWFWGVCLPSLAFVKSVKKQNGTPKDLKDLRLIASFERKRTNRFSALKERGVQTLRSMAKGLSRFFAGLRSGVKRKARVVYHRIKNRKRPAGKAGKNVADLQKVFWNVNTTTADYLVMRNWEGFYDDILLEGHNDIDLLCRDRDSRDIIVRLLDAKPLTADGFHYCFRCRDREVTLDTRVLGDGYYDRRWQREMLRRKRLHPLGFYVMDHENYYYSLIYHAIYQKKNGLSEEYAQRLNQMSSSDETFTQEGFAEQLDSFMRRKHYAYTATLDQSVIRNFSITPIPKKLRYPLNIRMRHAVQTLQSKHLLQRLKLRIRKLIIRG